MKTIIKPLLTLVLGFSMASSIAQVNEDRPVESFNGIDINGTSNVELIQGEIPSLKITGESGNTKSVKTEVRDGVLYIGRNSEEKEGLKKAKVIVTLSKINKIKLSGAADCKSSNTIVTDNLDIQVSGAGDLNLDVKATKLKSEISGAGDVRLKGQVTDHEIDLSGAGDLKAMELETENTTAQISGAGEARVNAKNNLTAKLSGAGGLFYKDEPANKNIEASTAATAKKYDHDNSVTIGGSGKDTTRLKFGDNHIIIIPGDGDDDDNDDARSSEKKDDTYHHWAGFDLGVNMLLNKYNEVKAPGGYSALEQDYGHSFNYRLNFWEQDFNIYQEKVNIVTGAGFEWANYGLANKYSLTPDTASFSANYTNVRFSKNRLQSIWINVPLLLEFNTSNNPKKSFHVAVGVIGGYRLSANYKQNFKFGGSEFESKTRDDYNLNRYKLGATARIGYRNVTFFADVNQTAFFKNGQGPQATPVTVGLTLVPFH